jgi:hypothetical protein
LSRWSSTTRGLHFTRPQKLETAPEMLTAMRHLIVLTAPAIEADREGSVYVAHSEYWGSASASDIVLTRSRDGAAPGALLRSSAMGCHPDQLPLSSRQLPSIARGVSMYRSSPSPVGGSTRGSHDRSIMGAALGPVAASPLGRLIRPWGCTREAPAVPGGSATIKDCPPEEG